MASESDGVGVPCDMAMLLDLLNSSEPRDDSANDAASEAELPSDHQAEEVPDDAGLQPNHQADEVPEVGSTMMGSAGQDAADLVSSRQSIVENRFAEHIVHAMSKLARS